MTDSDKMLKFHRLCYKYPIAWYREVIYNYHFRDKTGPFYLPICVVIKHVIMRLECSNVLTVSNFDSYTRI